MPRHSRPRRLFLVFAAALLAILAIAALVFREGLREEWLLWRLEHSDGDSEKACVDELGRMGSLRAIEPLATRLEGLPSSQEWHFYATRGVLEHLDALSALLSIAQARGEKSIPHLEKSRAHATGATSREALRQLILVAHGERATVDLGGRRPPGLHPEEVEE